MARVNVRSRDSFGSDSTYLGWYDDETTTAEVGEGKHWNGNNMIGNVSGLQIGYEEVIRTAKGRWVLHHDSRREFNGPEYREFITDREAQEWLMRADCEAAEKALEQWFGDAEEESGPDVGGRPAIGPRVQVALPAEVLAQVDALAAKLDIKRADCLRRLVVSALAAENA